MYVSYLVLVKLIFMVGRLGVTVNTEACPVCTVFGFSRVSSHRALTAIIFLSRIGCILFFISLTT